MASSTFFSENQSCSMLSKLHLHLGFFFSSVVDFFTKYLKLKNFTSVEKRDQSFLDNLKDC